MARNVIELNDDDLCGLVTRATELLERENLDAEHRRTVERLYAIYISEVIRRFRERLPKQALSLNNKSSKRWPAPVLG